MNFKEALQAIPHGQVLLFLGAGASLGAKNIRGQLPAGRELAKLLAEKCQVALDTGLDRVAEFFLEDFTPEELIALLRDELIAVEVSPHHNSLAKCPWMRVYTTNYDNVYEVARNSQNHTIESLCLTTFPEEAINTSQQILHINGSIQNLTTETLQNEFKLSTTSYFTAHFHESAWIETFRTDLRLAAAVFFVGYSMYDLDIQRIVFSTPELRNKTFFIIARDADRSEERILTRFGSVEKIGADFFAKLLEQSLLSPTKAPPAEERLKSWERKQPNNANELQSPTEDDVIQLMLWGKFDSGIAEYCRITPDAPPYLFPRSIVHQIKDELLVRRNDVIIHSHPGNGKSIIRDELVSLLCSDQATVFHLSTNNDVAITEARRLVSNAKTQTVLTISPYPGCIDLINDLAALPRENVRLALLARTSAHEVTFSSLRESFRTVVREFDVNKISLGDVSTVSGYLDLYGLWGEYSGLSLNGPVHNKEAVLRGKCKHEVSSILMMLFQAPQMKKRIEDVVSAFKRDDALYTTLVAIMILNTLDEASSGNTLLDLLDFDLQSKLRSKESNAIKDIISIESGGIVARSSIAATFMLHNVFDSEKVVSTLIRLAKEAGKRYELRPLLKEMVRYGNVQGIIRDDVNREKHAVRFYEAAKSIKWLNQHPHFWFQCKRTVNRILQGSLF